ncbi:MAG: DUF4349 domain-containing protein [Chloroflexi bacterium]|nr:DUF4349 domain-containing protein [Chloroflexota bacterium]
MSRKKMLIPIIALILLTGLLFACAPQTETVMVEVTRVVTETVEVEGEAIEMSGSSSRLSFASVADGFDDGVVAADIEAIDEERGELVAEPNESQQQEQFPQERLIIRNAELGLVVSDTDEAIFKITEMTESNGGWVVNSNVYKYNEDAKTGSITVRVPSSGFTSALEAMKGLAVEVTSESTSGQDVTDEYVDLALHLENLEATADRVRSFLDDTDDVEEALAVNVELSRLEDEIERVKGRVQFLSQSASFSTITVQLTPDVLSQPIEVGGWQPKGIAREAIEALIDGLQSIVSSLIWIGIYTLPIGLIYGIPTFFVVRFVWRRWRRRGQAATISES